MTPLGDGSGEPVGERAGRHRGLSLHGRKASFPAGNAEGRSRGPRQNV